MVSLRGLTLTAARPRIIVPLFARDPAALCPLAKAASADPAAELVELRLDPLPADEFLNALALVRGIVDKPLVVTIRTRAEGGELALTPDALRRAPRGVRVWRSCTDFFGPAQGRPTLLAALTHRIRPARRRCLAHGRRLTLPLRSSPKKNRKKTNIA